MRDFPRWTETNDCLRFKRVDHGVGAVSEVERAEILKFRCLAVTFRYSDLSSFFSHVYLSRFVKSE